MPESSAVTTDDVALPEWLEPVRASVRSMRPGDLSAFVPPDDADPREGAVLVLFGDGPQGPDLLLTERAHTMRSQPGQVSFPGGGSDEGEDAVRTALREAQEETGLDPEGVDVFAVLPLWASWCEPCKDELPHFARLARDLQGRVAVMGVDYQDTQPDLALQLLEDTGARFPQVADPGGSLAETYRIRGLPGILWVREDGSATFRNDRVRSYEELTELVSSQLGLDVGTPG